MEKLQLPVGIPTYFYPMPGLLQLLTVDLVLLNSGAKNGVSLILNLGYVNFLDKIIINESILTFYYM